MKPNKVAPWEGTIEWVGEPRTGTSKKGKPWSSVDFVLKYTGAQGNESHIIFNAFGDEKVNMLLAADLGTAVRVDWKPDAREYNGKWYGKLEAFGITILDQEEPEEEPKPTEMPKSALLFQQSTEAEDPNADLPFSQSPGVRG